jgi:hypothetical protein
MARVIQTKRAKHKHIIRVLSQFVTYLERSSDFKLEAATFSTCIGMATQFGLKSPMRFISEFSLAIPIPLIKHLALATPLFLKRKHKVEPIERNKCYILVTH